MKSEVFAVKRHILMSEDPAVNPRPMFEELPGKGGRKFPIPTPVRIEVHNAIAEEADRVVVRSVLFNRLVRRGPGDPRMQRATASFLEDLGKQQESDDETLFQTFERLKEFMRLTREEGVTPEREVADFAYRFGVGTAIAALRGEQTGIGLPELYLPEEYIGLTRSEIEILDFAGLHTEWAGLSALPESGYQSRNNPFRPLLSLIENGAKDIRLYDSGAVSFSTNISTSKY